MTYHVIDPKTRKFIEKPNGDRVWSLSRADAMRISEAAIVIALDERNLDDALNTYHNGRLFAQIHWDERNGWIS